MLMGISDRCGPQTGPHELWPSCQRGYHEMWPPASKRPTRTTKAPRTQGFRRCAEEDSNLHPVIPDQALNLVTRVSYPPYASRSSRTSGNLDTSDAMDDLDVATDVAAIEAPSLQSAAPFRAKQHSR